MPNNRSAAERDALCMMIAESIDALINLDVSSYGVIARLYQAARERAGAPLAMTAARGLQARLSDGGNFVVASGWVMPGIYPCGETDGPIGAATIGRALSLAFNARMIVLTEDRMVECTTAACRAAGISVLSEDDLHRAPRTPHPAFHHCIIVPFPVDDADARRETKRIFETYKPKAAIAIEKNGPNQHGRYSMVDGSDNSDCVAKIAHVFRAAKENGVLTIGIGDRGNEIGFGSIAEIPRKILPFGENATDATEVDILVTAAVSNWGASGIAASLASLLERSELLHDPATERRMLERCIDAGAVDGFLCRPLLMTDGMQESTHVAICALLNELVRAPAARLRSMFSTPVFDRP